MSRARRSLISDIVPGTTSHTTTTIAANKSILEVSLTQPRGHVNCDAYLSLFSELVSYCRDRVESVVALQEKLSQLGHRMGRRVLDLVVAREKISRRETRLLNILNFVALTLWTFLYGKQADSLKKVRDSESECAFCCLLPIIFLFLFFLSISSICSFDIVTYLLYHAIRLHRGSGATYKQVYFSSCWLRTLQLCIIHCGHHKRRAWFCRFPCRGHRQSFSEKRRWSSECKSGCHHLLHQISR